LGDSQGPPILYFHGCPGSRLEAGVLARAATQARARLIAVDRPGIGLSPAQPGRRILDWPADVARLADALRLDRFAILGFSGGGPYAAACALRIPDRLFACGLVAGAGPAGRTLSVLAHALPDVVVPFVRPFIRDRRAMTWWLRRVLWLARQPDRAAFRRPEVQLIVVASIVEALRQGSRGVAREVTLLGEPWGFALEDITMPIQLWHGEADAVVPIRVGRAAARRLPHVNAVFVPGEAHKSLLINRGSEILETLLARGSTQEASDGSRAGH
jgi:pimeloyl-ACP methyl ester carboxylesterase